MQMDPAGYRDGSNRLNAFHDNPAILADPLGLSAMKPIPNLNSPVFTDKATEISAAHTRLVSWGTINVYTGQKVETEESSSSDAIVIQFLALNSSSSHCSECHWLQIITRDRWEKNSTGTFVVNNNDTYEIDGMTYQYGTPHVDNGGLTVNPYYDRLGANLRSPVEVTIADMPTVTQKASGNVAFTVSVDDFLVCERQLVYHLHWERWSGAFFSDGLNKYRNIKGNMPLGLPTGKDLYVGTGEDGVPRYVADPRETLGYEL